MDVIVLDGNQRSALAVTRSLGKQGIKVRVGAETVPSLAATSKYCAESFIYPSPHRYAAGFIETIKDVTRQTGRAILLPMTDVTVGEILSHQSAFGRHIIIPSAEIGPYTVASDKAALFRLAEKLNVPIPFTRFSADYPDQEALVRSTEKLGFPLVVKPARSRIRTRHGWIDTGVQYAGNKNELREIILKEPFSSFPFIVQEKIQGPGTGVFLLIHQDNVLARFAHRRIREKPPSGGVSVICESIAVPPDAYDSSMRLLRDMNWCGVVMVEFKLDRRDNVCKLMEINARFWGSLQLAISAGVDFPYLLYRLAAGMGIEKCDNYQTGLRSRWELGDLDHLYLRLFKRKRDLALPHNAPTRSKVLMSFVRDFVSPSVRAEVLRMDDPLPFLYEVRRYVKKLS